MKRLIVILLLLLFGCNMNEVVITSGDTVPEATDTIRIAAFNIQDFGPTTLKKPEVMNILARIAREFDMMLVQEISDASGETAPFYLQRINEMEGPDYAFVISLRLGRTSSKEAYAYFYNTETVDFIEDYVYDDTADGEDDFEREPYIATFRSGNFDFTLVGIHTKPDKNKATAKTWKEIAELKIVYDSVIARNPSEKDVIVLGDFNADGDYFDEEDNTNPFKAAEFHWVITNDMDTMTKTDWTYDRIVITDNTLPEYVPSSASVFYFDKEYGIHDRVLIEDVSDHYPVYAEFKTNLPNDDPAAISTATNGKMAVVWGKVKLLY